MTTEFYAIGIALYLHVHYKQADQVPLGDRLDLRGTRAGVKLTDIEFPFSFLGVFLMLIPSLSTKTYCA